MPIPQIPTDLPPPPVLACPVCPAGPGGDVGPQGPQGPPGEAGGTSSLQGFANLIDTGTQQDITTFMDAVYVAMEAVPMDIDLRAVLDPDTSAGVQLVSPLIQPSAPVELIAQNVPPDGQQQNVPLQIEQAAEKALKFIFNETENVPVETQDFNISTFGCDPAGGPTHVELQTTGLVGPQQNQQLMFTLLFQKLDQLLRCCTPCDNFDWVLIGNITGHAQQFVVGSLDAVKFQEFQTPDGIDSWTGSPDKKRYGQMQWIFRDGTLGDPISILSSQQVERAPVGWVNGFAYRLNKGVQMLAYWRGTNTPAGSPFKGP